VQQRVGLLHDPPVLAQAGAVRGAAAGDDGLDAFDPDPAAVAVVVVAAIGVKLVGSSARSSSFASDRRDLVEQRQQLSDVVAVPAGQTDRERNTTGFGEDMVLGARPRAVDRARTRFGPPLSARPCELSITAFDQSSRSAPRNSASSSSCSRCHTPALCQSRSRRQHVIPDPKPNSCGRNSHGIPVCSTNRIPHSALRSSNGLRPGYRNRRDRVGNSGSTRSHSPSGTIHGGC
jgi:hypothetical protein